MDIIKQPKITASDIILYTDGGDVGGDDLKLHLGNKFPIIKLRNTTIEASDIKSVHISNGRRFLPTISLVIDDTNGNFIDTDFPTRDDVLTTFIGNTFDDSVSHPHTDWNILDISSTKKGVISITGNLMIDGALEKEHGVTHVGSGFDALGVLCDDLGLGLVSNVTNTDDARTWYDKDRNKLQQIKYISKNLWGGEIKFFHCFVDIYYRLNVVELSNVFDTKSETSKQHYDLLNGEELETPEDVILNNKVDGDEPNGSTNQFKISSWHAVSNVGNQQQTKPSGINHTIFEKNYENREIEAVSSVTVIENKGDSENFDVSATPEYSIISEHIGSIHTDSKLTVLPSVVGEQQNMIGRYRFLGTQHLEVSMSNMNSILGMYDIVPLKIYSSPTKHNKLLDESATPNDVGSQQENGEDSGNNGEKQQILEFYSGDVVITAQDLTWRRSTIDVKLSYRLHKRMWKTNRITD